MNELRVGSVRHRRGREERFRLTRWKPRAGTGRTSCGTPPAAARAASGRPRSGSARRNPPRPAPSPPERRRPRRSTLAPAPRPARSSRLSSDGAGVVMGEGEPEGRVRMHAGSDRVRLLRERNRDTAPRSRRRAAGGSVAQTLASGSSQPWSSSASLSSHAQP